MSTMKWLYGYEVTDGMRVYAHTNSGFYIEDQDENSLVLLTRAGPHMTVYGVEPHDKTDSGIDDAVARLKGNALRWMEFMK
jgi:hypothetical protein